MKKILSFNVFQSFIDSFNCLKTKIRKKDLLFFFCSATLFLYFSLSIIFGRKPFNYVYNALLILLFVLVIATTIKRKKLNYVLPFLVFWGIILIFILVTFAVSKTFSITPLANILALITAFSLFKISDHDEKEYLGLLIYTSLVLFLIAVCIRYIPKMSTSNNIILLMNDGYFFNLDGMTDLLAILFGSSLYYVRKKELLPLLFAIPSTFLCVVSMRRASLLIIFASILIFIYSFFKRGYRKYFILVVLGLVVLFFILLFMPFMSDVSTRIIQTISTFLGSGEETSMINRFLMILRGYFKGIVTPFSFYGFNNIILVAKQTNHDTFGDMVFNFGGFLACCISFALVLQSVRCIFDSNKKTTYLMKFFGFTMLILFFVTAIFNNREICLFFGMFSGLISSTSFKNSQKYIVSKNNVFEISI